MMRETLNFSINSDISSRMSDSGELEEEIGGEPLDKLRFADAGGADKNEAHGLALGLQSGAAALDSGANGVHGLVLPDDMCLEPSGKTGETLKLVGANV